MSLSPSTSFPNILFLVLVANVPRDSADLSKQL